MICEKFICQLSWGRGETELILNSVSQTYLSVVCISSVTSVWELKSLLYVDVIFLGVVIVICRVPCHTALFFTQLTRPQNVFLHSTSTQHNTLTTFTQSLTNQEWWNRSFTVISFENNFWEFQCDLASFLVSNYYSFTHYYYYYSILFIIITQYYSLLLLLITRSVNRIAWAAFFTISANEPTIGFSNYGFINQHISLSEAFG